MGLVTVDVIYYSLQIFFIHVSKCQLKIAEYCYSTTAVGKIQAGLTVSERPGTTIIDKTYWDKVHKQHKLVH